MLDPIRLTTDLFKEKNLSDTDLHGFTEEFLIRLAKPENNPAGIYNTLLSETTTLYQTFYQTYVAHKTELAISKSITLGLNQAFRAVIDKLRSLQGLIKFLFSENSAIYHEFFPRGMTQYHHVPLANADLLLSRFRTMATMHLQATHPTEVAELNTLITKFLDEWLRHENIQAQIDATANARNQQRKALTLQLTRCFLIIASNNLENPHHFTNYYEKRYLPIRKGKKKEKPA